MCFQFKKALIIEKKHFQNVYMERKYFAIAVLLYHSATTTATVAKFFH